MIQFPITIKIDCGRKLPVVILSTSSYLKDIDEFKQLDADLYVTKPSKFAKLKIIMEELLVIDDLREFKNNNSFVFSGRNLNGSAVIF
jgi:hypothetical protein